VSEMNIPFSKYADKRWKSELSDLVDKDI
jgi:hypothetical protein